MDDRIVDLIEEGFDVAVRITRLADSSLIARRIATSRLVVCASPDYLAKHGIPRTPADLVHHNCLNRSHSPQGNRWRFSGPGGEYTVRVSGNFWSNSGDALRTAALAGLGVLTCPSFMVGEDLRAGRLKTVLEDYVQPELPIQAVYPHQRHMTAKLGVFIDYLIERFAAAPSWDDS